MRYNNRMPAYKRKEYEKRVVYHTEVKDGKTIFVKGKKPDPYENVPCDSLKLKSRIDTGVFENHEGAMHKLEKAQGSDIAQAQIEEAQRDFENRKEEAQAKSYRKKVRAELEKNFPETSKMIEE